MKITNEIKSLIVLDLILFFLFWVLNLHIYMSLSFILWLSMVVIALKKLEEASGLLMFLLAFFTFLMGREMLELLKIRRAEIKFVREINDKTYLMILISLLGLFIGYFLLSNFINNKRNQKEKKNKIIDNKDEESLVILRNITEKIFYIGFIPKIYELIEVGIFVIKNGYYEYYVSYRPSVNYIFAKLGDMAIIAFWVYLCTLPSKKESKNKIILFIIYLFVSLISGKRYPFISGLMTLFVYYIYRNKKDKWIGKFEKRLMFLSIPLIIVLMTVINVVRFGLTKNISSFGISEFFYRQGISITVLKRSLLHWDKFPTGRHYMFGSIIEFFQNNIISRALGVISYKGNTIDHALKGHSLQHAISYIIYGENYLKGYGLGSSYVFEAFHDFGYMGILVANIIYGLILNKFYNFNEDRVFINALYFIMLNSLILAPRGNFDAFIVSLIDMTTWGSFLVIYLLYLLISRYKKKKERLLKS